MAYACKAFCGWSLISLALPLSPALLTLLVLLTEIIEAGEALTMEDLTVVVTGESKICICDN